MTADGRFRCEEPGQDFRRLPPAVRLDETIASVDPDPVPEPEAGRNATSIALCETTDRSVLD